MAPEPLAHHSQWWPRTPSSPRTSRSRLLTVLGDPGPAEGPCSCARGVRDAVHEIAEVVGKTSAAVRQIAHRAREHVVARRPRMQVDRAQQRAAVEKFMAAISTGDVQALVEVLAPDVVLIADGGGVVAAARKPITGVEKVVGLLAHAVKIRASWRPPPRQRDAGCPDRDRYWASSAVSLVVLRGRRITASIRSATRTSSDGSTRWWNCAVNRLNPEFRFSPKNPEILSRESCPCGHTGDILAF